MNGGRLEVNALYQLWKERLKEVPELINEDSIATKIRQSLVAYNYRGFLSWDLCRGPGGCSLCCGMLCREGRGCEAVMDG